MKKLFYLLVCVSCVGCSNPLESFGLKKRCFKCTTRYMGYGSQDKTFEVCGEKDKDKAQKEGTGSSNGIIYQTTCIAK